jgi:predicted MPP superfamily phosphohydrolase
MDRLGTRGVFATFGAIAGLIAVIASYSVAVAPRWLEVVRLRIALPGLPDTWRGARIAHLSDFHAGGAVSLDLLRRAKAIAVDSDPDIIALTGDFYDNGRPVDAGDLFSDWPDAVPVVAVLGNHDHRATDLERQRLLDELRAAGVDILSNRARQIELRGQPAWIVGVDDPFSLLMDEATAFSDVPDRDDVLLYLAHSPVAAETLPDGRVRLMLTGHTHGGQVRLVPDGRVPFVRFLRRMRGSPPRPDPTVHRGVHWRRGAVLVISNGLGLSKLPLRFRTRPQVILIELAQAEPDGPACDEVARYVTRMNAGPAWLNWFS